jgi:FkbM family methyltransferase
MILSKYLNILRHHDLPRRLIISRLLWHSRLCLLIKIRRDYCVLRFHASSLSAGLWMRPNDRSNEEKLIARYLRPGDCVVDMGANIGALALTAAWRVGPKGAVYGFQAHSRTFAYLQDNIGLNGSSNLRAFNLAVGKREGAVQFSDIRFDDQNSIIMSGKGITVPLRPPDALEIAEPHIHLLKVDTEGYEKFVFQGASQLLTKTSTIYFESWDTSFARYGYLSPDVFRLLEVAGFRVFSLRKESFTPISDDYNTDGVENLLALRLPQHLWSEPDLPLIPDLLRFLQLGGAATAPIS